jgi:DNA polymerase-1
MYTYIASIVWQDPSITKDDDRRSTAKVILLALFYGAGVGRLVQASGLSEEDVRRFLARVYREFPGLRDLIGDHAIGGRVEGLMTRKAKERGLDGGMAYVMTKGGRRFSMPNGEEYKALNGVAQGSAADMLKSAIIRLDRAGLSDTIIVPVHDELVLSIPIEEADMAEEIRQLMEDHTWEVPMTAEASGPFKHWGEAYA